MTAAEFDAVVAKLGFETRQSDHLLAWFKHNGKLITRTKRSNVRGEVPMGHAIRQQMKLSETQLAEAIRCTFGNPEYVEHLMDKGLIEKPAEPSEPEAPTTPKQKRRE